jgi:aerobic C4-dicarboxylate transport protein
VATVLIGSWTREIDRERAGRVLTGELPFDEHAFEATDDHHAEPAPAAQGGVSATPR